MMIIAMLIVMLIMMMETMIIMTVIMIMIKINFLSIVMMITALACMVAESFYSGISGRTSTRSDQMIIRRPR